MRGFQVRLQDGSITEIEATHYDVDPDGQLIVWGGTDSVATLAAESWIEIRSVGNPLSEQWPDPRMVWVMKHISQLLIAEYGGWIRNLDEDRLADWRLNDFDGLLAAILEASSLDPKTAEDRPRIREVRQIIANGFDVRLRFDRRYEGRFLD